MIPCSDVKYILCIGSVNICRVQKLLVNKYACGLKRVKKCSHTHFHYLMSIRFESLNRSIWSSFLTSFVKGSFCDVGRTSNIYFLPILYNSHTRALSLLLWHLDLCLFQYLKNIIWKLKTLKYFIILNSKCLYERALNASIYSACNSVNKL